VKVKIKPMAMVTDQSMHPDNWQPNSSGIERVGLPKNFNCPVIKKKVK
jgi:hypothetical protein